MSTSEVELDAAQRAKFARGGVFLLLGGALVVVFALAGIQATASLYAGLVGGTLALAVAALTSDEPLVRAVWFAPGVAAVGVAVASVAPGGKLGVGAVIAALGILQLVTAGLLSDR